MTLEKPSPQIQALSLVLWFQNEGGWIPQKEGSFSLNPPRTSQNPPEPPRPPGQDERTSPGRHRDDAVPAAGLKPADLAVVQVHRALVEASQSCGEWRFWAFFRVFWGAKGSSFESAGWGFDVCGFGSDFCCFFRTRLKYKLPKSHTGPGTSGLLRSFQIVNTPVRGRSGNGAFQACSSAAHYAGTSNDHVRRPKFASLTWTRRSTTTRTLQQGLSLRLGFGGLLLGRSQLVTGKGSKKK